MKKILSFDQFCKISSQNENVDHIDYYLSKNNVETKVSKDEFFKIGMEKNFMPKKDNQKGFQIKQDGNRFIALFNENKELSLDDIIKLFQDKGIYTFKLNDPMIKEFEEYLKSSKIEYREASQLGTDITFYSSKHPKFKK